MADDHNTEKMYVNAFCPECDIFFDPEDYLSKKVIDHYHSLGISTKLEGQMADNKPKPTMWNGILHPSVNQCAKANCVTVGTMQYRLSKGYTCDDDMKPDVRRRRKIEMRKHWLLWD